MYCKYTTDCNWFSQKKFRALFGGGRYDHLLETYGATENIPAVGFGFGDAVIMELLEEKELLPAFATTRTVRVVVYASQLSCKSNAIRCVSALRNKNISAELLGDKKKLKWVLQKADKLKAGRI